VSRSLRHNNRAFGSLPYRTAALPDASDGSGYCRSCLEFGGIGGIIGAEAARSSRVTRAAESRWRLVRRRIRCRSKRVPIAFIGFMSALLFFFEWGGWRGHRPWGDPRAFSDIWWHLPVWVAYFFLCICCGRGGKAPMTIFSESIFKTAHYPTWSNLNSPPAITDNQSCSWTGYTPGLKAARGFVF
jgi:hypothetical protein